MTLQDYILEKKPEAVWDPERNGSLTPADVTPGSHKKVWWRCEKGHSWQAVVYNVAISDCGCPYCNGLKAFPGETDLGSCRPDIVALWDKALNGVLTPRAVTPGSKTRVWWRCEKGHSWQAAIYSVALEGCGCPYCAGTKAIPGETDLVTVRPDIVAQLDSQRNGDLDPATLLPSSHVRLWWKCQLGHSWEAPVFSRTREKSSGCPYCTGRKVLQGFNDLETLKPKLAKEWHQPLNGELKPSQVSLGSNKKVWWRCADGHVWRTAIFARTKKRGSGCPVCAGKAKVKRPDIALQGAKRRSNLPQAEISPNRP